MQSRDETVPAAQARTRCVVDWAMRSSVVSRAVSGRFCISVLAAVLGSVGCLGTLPGAADAPPLIVRPGCSLWTGTVKGNDPNVAVQLELCPYGAENTEVAGRIQFTSPRSGWSVREIEGGVTPDGLLVLRELQFDVAAPEYGWMFCLVDRYEIEGAGPDSLTGRYDSKACSDHGKIDLVRAE